MPKPDGFEVEPDDVTVHAGRLGRVADGIATATDAARYVQLHGEAYGQICRFVPAILNDLSTPLIDGLQTAVDSLRGTADRLRATAQAYTTADTVATQALPGAAS
jgi:hypothetical protein